MSSSFYCLPNNSTCWPSGEEWDNLNATIQGRLTVIHDPSKTIETCLSTNQDGTLLAQTENGACMPHQECFYEYCHLPNKTIFTEEQEAEMEDHKSTLYSLDLPTFTVKAMEQSDVVSAIEFANQYNIAVSIKTSGHNYAGSSTAKGSLLIWMYHYSNPLEISNSFADTCGTSYDATLTLGGGSPWGAAYNKIYQDGRYDILGGGSVNVGCCGGWLAGGGITTMSRFRGLGIDNVVQYEVVLASGEAVTVNACSNIDLFWALRGGGGGAFGVVTKVTYKLHPKKSLIHLTLSLHNHNQETLDQFVDAWVDIVDPPNLDSFWGGYWSLSCSHIIRDCIDFNFYGTLQDAEDTLITKLRNWAEDKPQFSIRVQEYPDGYLEKQAKDSPCPMNGCGSKTACSDFGGIAVDFAGNRGTFTRPISWLIPISFYDNSESAKEIYKETLAANFYIGSFDGYILGGSISSTNINETSVHPSLRQAANSIIGVTGYIDEFRLQGMDFIRQKVNDSAPCFNHDGEPWLLGPTVQEWQMAYFGSNLERLQQIKSDVDPDSRFNTFQGIGYIALNEFEVTADDIPALPQAVTACTSIGIIQAILFSFFPFLCGLFKR